MKILFITMRFPYPPLKGDQVRSYHQIRILSKHHKISLISFADSSFEKEHKEHMADYCEKIMLVPIRKLTLIKNLLFGLFLPYPFQTSMYQSLEMEKVIQESIRESKYDIVHLQLARMAPYFEKQKHITRIIDLIDALSLNMKRRCKKDKGLLKLASYIEWQRLKKYEREICQNFDGVTVVSEIDKKNIGDFDNLHINPNGVAISSSISENTKQYDLIFTGNMSYFPNVHAILWFVKNVFPLIQKQKPEICLAIVGVNPCKEVLNLVSNSIKVTGYVENIQDYIKNSKIAIAPMLSGSGIQNKVLEAMICEVPIVATNYALGGIEVEHGKHILIANDIQSFSDAILELLSNKSLNVNITKNAKKLIEERYSWEYTISKLETLYKKYSIKQG